MNQLIKHFGLSWKVQLAPTFLILAMIGIGVFALQTLRESQRNVDKLVAAEAYVNEGPRQKRIRPAPMGRAYRYQRRTSHIVVKLSDEKR